MGKILELVKKNFKLLVRAKVSALIIFVGPLLLVSLLGLAYSQSSTFSLTASVFSDGYTNLTDSLITKMTNQNFRVIKQDSLDNCVNSLKRGESQACIIFPAGMSVSEGKTNEVTFYVDYSQINLVWLMLDVMSARISEKSGEISRELTSDILTRMQFVEDRLSTGGAIASSLSSIGEGVKASSVSAKSDFQRLDISVDFAGLDITGSKAASQNISSVIAGVSRSVAALSNATGHSLDSIESSASAIKAVTNESDIVAEAEDIDDAATDISSEIDSMVINTSSGISNATAMLLGVSASFDRIATKLAETNSKIQGISSQRDALLPQFDNISTQIDDMVGSVAAMQSALTEAKEKIDAVKGLSAESIVAPITTKIEPVATQKTHFNSLFPTLLVLVIMITGVLLSSTLVVVEKKSKAFLRNNFTPTSYFTFNIAGYITALAVLCIQLLLFVSVSVFFFETEVLASVLLVLLLVFLTATVFIFIGMFVGFLFRTEETVTLASITLATILLLFSSAVIPLESLSGLLKSIAMFNPFVVAEMSLKQAIIFQFSFSKATYGIVVLSSYAAGIFAILILAENYLKRLSLSHFAKHHRAEKAVADKKGSVDIAKPDVNEKHDINELAVKKE